MRLISRCQGLAITTGLIALLGCSPAPSQTLLPTPTQSPTPTIEKPLQVTPFPTNSISPHLLLGNPSGASATICSELQTS
ncbi:MAG: hypothetical protein KAF91_00740, partial [Nostoc sp. TH1S01]|nr:hypothetical protein [Nostoc sp. TH1S01]